MDWDDYYKDFEKRLESSKPSVVKVAKWLRRRWTFDRVWVPETQMAPSRYLMNQYKDGGDVLAEADGDLFRVEVKHRRKLNFTSKETFPFFEAIVCSLDSFQTKCVNNEVPNVYFFVNKPMTHVAMAPTREMKECWRLGWAYDAKRGYEYEAYFIKKDDLTFYDIQEKGNE